MVVSPGGVSEAHNLEQRRTHNLTPRPQVRGTRFRGSTIEIDGNLIGNAGAYSISKLLRTSPWLQHLYLRGNFFGKEGLKVLLETARDCPHVKDLTLRGNDDIHREGGGALWDELNELLLERGRSKPHEQVFLGEKIKMTTAPKPASGGSLGALGAIVF